MSEREIKNAVIESARIYICDHTGCLTARVAFAYGDGVQGFGGFALYLPKDFKHHQLLSHCGHFVYRMLQVAGVDEWSKLPGRTVRVDASWEQVYRIGHIVNDDWFDPEAEFKADCAKEQVASFALWDGIDCGVNAKPAAQLWKGERGDWGYSLDSGSGDDLLIVGFRTEDEARSAAITDVRERMADDAADVFGGDA